MHTRRTALAGIAGAAAVPLFGKQTSVGKPIFFDPSDYAIVTRMVDLIIPRTATPGALDANVPFHIDQQVAADPSLQAEFKTGLALFRDNGFAALPEPQQVAILQAASDNPTSPQGPFFQKVKSLTVDWYYASEEGLVQELGFHGNTYRPDFPGCTHPEHWPTIEKLNTVQEQSR